MLSKECFGVLPQITRTAVHLSVGTPAGVYGTGGPSYKRVSCSSRLEVQKLSRSKVCVVANFSASLASTQEPSFGEMSSNEKAIGDVFEEEVWLGKKLSCPIADMRIRWTCVLLKTLDQLVESLDKSSIVLSRANSADVRPDDTCF